MTLKYKTLRKNILWLLIIIHLRVKYVKYLMQRYLHDLKNSSGLNTKLATLATKPELKAEQNKIVKWQTSDISYAIAFDEKSSWSFNIDLTRKVVIFGVDDISSPIMTIIRIIFQH